MNMSPGAEAITKFLNELLVDTCEVQVAWRTFDGEGGYDYRSYEDDEDYHAGFIARNGPRYASWVEPLFIRRAGSNDGHGNADLVSTAFQLGELSARFSADYPGKALNKERLQKVLEYCRDKLQPKISATENGDICLTWDKMPRTLSVLFDENDQMFWSTFIDGERQRGQGCPFISFGVQSAPEPLR